MRPQDKAVFLDAARHFHSWILVRRTNPASLPYIGLPGYSPKRIDYKAKTGDLDVPPWKLAGLVIDPNLHPNAFKPGKASKGLEAWRGMAPLLRSVYRVDMNRQSHHYGCLQLQGHYVHADSDLYDIIDVDAPTRNLAAVETLLGQPHRRGAIRGPYRSSSTPGSAYPWCSTERRRSTPITPNRPSAPSARTATSPFSTNSACAPGTRPPLAGVRCWVKAQSWERDPGV